MEEEDRRPGGVIKKEEAWGGQGNLEAGPQPQTNLLFNLRGVGLWLPF